METRSSSNSTKSKKARKAPSQAQPQPILQFAQPDKAGFRYTQGGNARFAIGASRHHGTEFALYQKTPEMSRFTLIGKFEALIDAQAAAQQADATPKPSAITSNGNS